MTTRNHSYYSKSIPYNHIYHNRSNYITSNNYGGSISEFEDPEDEADEDYVEVPEDMDRDTDQGITSISEELETDNSIADEEESISEMEARQLSYGSLPSLIINDSHEYLTVRTYTSPLQHQRSSSRSTAVLSDESVDSEESGEEEEVENVSSNEEENDTQSETEDSEFVNVKVIVEKDPYAIYSEAVKVTVSVQPPSEIEDEISEESQGESNEDEDNEDVEGIENDSENEESMNNEEESDENSSGNESEEKSKSTHEMFENKTDLIENEMSVNKPIDNKIQELLEQAISESDKIKNGITTNSQGESRTISSSSMKEDINLPQGSLITNGSSGTSIKEVCDIVPKPVKNLVNDGTEKSKEVASTLSTASNDLQNQIGNLESKIMNSNTIMESSVNNVSSNIANVGNDIQKSIQGESDKVLGSSVNINPNIVQKAFVNESKLAQVGAKEKLNALTKTVVPSKTNIVTQVATVMVHHNPELNSAQKLLSKTTTTNSSDVNSDFLKAVLSLDKDKSTVVPDTLHKATKSTPEESSIPSTSVSKLPVKRIVTSADYNTRQLSPSPGPETEVKADNEDYLTIFADSDETSEEEDENQIRKPKVKELTEDEKKALEIEKDKLLQEWRTALTRQQSIDNLDEKFAQIIEDMVQELHLDPVQPKLPKKLKEVIKDRDPSEQGISSSKSTVEHSSASTIRSVNGHDDDRENGEDVASIKSEDIDEDSPGAEALRTAKLLDKYAKASAEEARLALEKEKEIAISEEKSGSKSGSARSQRERSDLHSVSPKTSPKISVPLSRRNSIILQTAFSPKANSQTMKSLTPKKSLSPKNSVILPNKTSPSSLTKGSTLPTTPTMKNSGTAIKNAIGIQKQSPSASPKLVAQSLVSSAKTANLPKTQRTPITSPKNSTSIAPTHLSSLSKITTGIPSLAKNKPSVSGSPKQGMNTATSVKDSVNKFQRTLSQNSLKSQSSPKMSPKPPLRKTGSQASLNSINSQASPRRNLSKNNSFDSLASVGKQSPSMRSRQGSLQTQESIEEESLPLNLETDSLLSVNQDEDREDETPSPSRRRKWKNSTEIAQTLSHYMYIVKTETIEECISEIIPLLTQLIQMHRKYKSEHDLPTLIAALSATRVLCERLHHVKIVSGEKALRNVDLSWLIRVLCKISAHPDSKVKPEAGFTLARLVIAGGPDLITRPIYFLLVMENEGHGHKRGSQGSKTKAAALDTLTYALLTFPKEDFDNLEEIAGWVCLVVFHPHRRVRQAALECISVLGNRIGSHDAAIARFRKIVVKEAEQNYNRSGSDDSEGSPVKKTAIRTFDGKGIFDVSAITAISSRLQRRILPVPSPKGLIEYGVKVPTGQELVMILTKMQEKEEEEFEVSTSDESLKSSHSMDNLFSNSQADDSEAESIRMSDLEKTAADEAKSGVKLSPREDEVLAAAQDITDLITPDVAYILAGKGRVNKQDIEEDEDNLKLANAPIDADARKTLKQFLKSNDDLKKRKHKKRKRKKKQNAVKAEYGSSEDDIF